MAKVLVTGATGLVGSHLVERLLARGDKVRALVRLTSRTEHLKMQGVELVLGDLNDPDSLKEATRGIEIVYHCAARPPLDGTRNQFYRDNVVGTENLLQAGLRAGIERFVHVSTVDVYGYGHHDGADESAPFKADGLYSWSKIEAERAVMRYHQRHHLPVSIIRPCLVYGPRDRHLLPTALQLILWKHPPLIGHGKHLLDLVYAGDVAEALILAGVRPEAIGQAYNITDGMRRTLLEVVEQLARIIGRKPKYLQLPYSLTYGTALFVSALSYWLKFPVPSILRWEIIKAMGHDRHFNISKAVQQLGYRPRIQLEHGLQLTLDWHRSRGALSTGY